VGTADGGTVVKVLSYKSEGRWFDSNFHLPAALTLSAVATVLFRMFYVEAWKVRYAEF
jgi:hypothetical protein